MTWLVAKCKKNEIEIFKKNFQNFLKNEVIFYQPRFEIDRVSVNGKVKKIRKFILGQYIFCKTKFFENKIKSSYKFIKGLEYFLNGSQKDQNGIEQFIEFCKKNEDDKGNLKNSFFYNGFKNKFKFLSGPFVNQVFKIIFENKKKFFINLNNKNISILKSSNYIFQTD